MPNAYYNEHDAKAAAWLRELIAQGHIAPGEVDERSVTDVAPDDLRGFTQCHFFAGIGVWSQALRGAGWSDADPVWTGSCPCQPFSASGKRGGTDDHRHLWPAWFRLIRECQPNVCFGEQVASPDGLAWFDFVSADLEGAGYAVGAADTCAAGVGAPHIRQRLYFVADAERGSAERHGHEVAGASGSPEGREPQRQRLRTDVRYGSDVGGMDDTAGTRCVGPLGGPEGEARHEARVRVSGSGCDARARRLADAEQHGLDGTTLPVRPGRQDEASAVERGAGFWSAVDWIPCADGKARPVEPGSFPLVTGAPARVVRLRGYGNALCAPQAQAFIEAYRSLR